MIFCLSVVTWKRERCGECEDHDSRKQQYMEESLGGELLYYTKF